MSRARQIHLGLAAVLAACFFAPASASAATVNIGSALTNPPTAALCTNCVGVQRGQAGGMSPLPIVAPVNGTITAWSVRTNDMGALYTLRVLRPAGATAYTGAGSSPAPSAIPAATDTVYSYTASLAIKQGDAIGVGLNAAAGGLPQYTGANMADIVGYSTTVFSDGASSGTIADIPLHELLVQATISYCTVPSVTGLTEAAAQGALTAAGCTPAITKKALKLKKKTKKNRKKNKQIRAQNGIVLSQTIAGGTTAGPADPVNLEVGQIVKKKKKKKKKK